VNRFGGLVPEDHVFLAEDDKIESTLHDLPACDHQRNDFGSSSDLFDPCNRTRGTRNSCSLVRCCPRCHHQNSDEQPRQVIVRRAVDGTVPACNVILDKKEAGVDFGG